jgi:hypothetical protein
MTSEHEREASLREHLAIKVYGSVDVKLHSV